MAFTIDSIVRVVLKITNQGERSLNVFHYNMLDTPAGDMITFVTDWWNAYKTVIRGVFPSNGNILLNSVSGEDLLGDRDFAEYIIPDTENVGTRTTSGDLSPSFLGVGVKVVVPNRQVRPGGKRFAALAEVDVTGQIVTSTVITATGVLMAALLTDFHWNGLITVDSSAYGIYGTGRPAVLPEHFVRAVGYVVNPNVTSQVSRKRGHGV